jgi:hypothetical protein
MCTIVVCANGSARVMSIGMVAMKKDTYTAQRFKALSLMGSCVSLLAPLSQLHRALSNRKTVVRLQLWIYFRKTLEEETFVVIGKSVGGEVVIDVILISGNIARVTTINAIDNQCGRRSILRVSSWYFLGIYARHTCPCYIL